MLGLLLICLFHCQKNEGYWVTKNKVMTGISLGKIIIIRQSLVRDITLRHEQGHQKQSKYLGWLYLIIIGLPSLIGNILHRFIKFDYYRQPWEAWADKLGGVNRRLTCRNL